MAKSKGAGDDETVPRKRAARPVARAREFGLSVSEGPDQGSTWSIEASQPGRVLVGTSPVCTVRLTDRSASRRHLALELTGDGVRATDLGSTNGTRINGLSVVEAVLEGGERLQVGATTIEVIAREAVETKLPLATNFGPLFGASPAMRKLYPLCKRLAASDVPVVIEGETGTGKEVLAEAIHEESDRADRPFVIFDCTTVPSNLFESALFGHERGAFTGANDTRRGVFEQAHGGTLLLDEIGDLDLELQAKLLRAIERSEVQRVGGNKWIKVDVRVLAATRRDLDALVQEGRFRDDLFYRLAVARIELPPLRKRAGDVVKLAELFWGRMGGDPAGLPEAFADQIARYDWPGNVRELHNAVARRVALGDLDVMGPSARGGASGDDADGALERILALELPFPRARKLATEAFERRYLERVLDQHEGNVAKAADAAGVARRYFRLLRARNREPSDE